MNVKEILASWLKEHGYDGLYNVDCDCGCWADDDFIPCGTVDEIDCIAGIERIATKDDEDDVTQEGDKLIGPKKKCGECDHFDKLRFICYEHQDFLNVLPEKWTEVKPDNESCDDFEPKND